MSDNTPPSHPTDGDPRRALRALIERGEGTSTAATMLRLLWLRREHPEASVSTEVAELEDDVVVIRASISLGNGAAGSGISAEHVGDAREWPAAIERTETKAIARALDTLGYVLEASTAREAASTEAAAEPQPQIQAPPPARPEPAQLRPVSRPEPVPSTPEPTPEARETPPPPQMVGALRRIDRRPSEAPATAAEDDDHLEDYSWTAFWSRAKELGLDRTTVEERIGRPIQGLSPLQLRTALEQTGIDFGHGR